MADTRVARITGHANADALPIEVNLVMTDASLPGSEHADGAARLEGYGAIPAAWARDLVLDAPGATQCGYGD